MGKHTSRRTETVTRSGNSFNVSGASVRKGATGATVLTATAAVTASLAFGNGVAQAEVPQVTDALAGLHGQGTALQDQLADALGLQSGGHLGGLAAGPNFLTQQVLKVIPDDLDKLDLKTKITDYVQSLTGHELAIAILPGAAVAIPLGQGTSATAISVFGMAAATDGITKTFDDLWAVVVIPGASLGPIQLWPALKLGDILSWAAISRDDLPGDLVFCMGALAYANSGTAGSCLNVAALLDVRYDKPDGELQLGLTNPLSVITYLTDPGQLLPVIGNALTGQPIYLLKDFARLNLNGPENIGLTSSYGFATGRNGAPVSLSWLGAEVGLFPGVTHPWGTGGWLASSPEFVNYLSLPSFGFAMPTDLSSLIPSLSFSDYNVLDLFTFTAWNTNGLLQGELPGIEQGDFLKLLGLAGSVAGLQAVSAPAMLSAPASRIASDDAAPSAAQRTSFTFSSEEALGGTADDEAQARIDLGGPAGSQSQTAGGALPGAGGGELAGASPADDESSQGGPASSTATADDLPMTPSDDAASISVANPDSLAVG